MKKRPFKYGKKKILLKKFNEDYKAELEVEEVAEKMQVEADKIVVKKVSFAGKFFEGMMDLFYKLGKVILFLLIAFIMSAGATALVNPSMRDILFNYLPFMK